MFSSLNSQMRLDNKLPIYEVSLTSSCQTTDGAKDFHISGFWRTVSSADWILNKLTLCSATTTRKWSSQICLCEHNVYREFITLAVWKYFCKMQHPVAGRRGEGSQHEPIVCEWDMQNISHAFLSADICWHFVASNLFKCVTNQYCKYWEQSNDTTELIVF